MLTARFIDTEELIERLDKLYFRIERSKLPVGLHAWPKNGKPNWCGVGLIDWGGESDPLPFFDVYVGDRSKFYHDINHKLCDACKQVGVRFTSMA